MQVYDKQKEDMLKSKYTIYEPALLWTIIKQDTGLRTEKWVNFRKLAVLK